MTITLPTVAFTLSGIIMILVAIPLIQRRIPPNQLYGLRVRATYADNWV